MSSDAPVQSPDGSTTYRPARSKNGCNACRRRKVRCNERKPRCSHCERLNLDCTWNRGPGRSRKESTDQSQSGQPDQPDSIHVPFESFGSSNFSGVFNSTWDEAMLLSPSSWPDYGLATPGAPGLLPYSLGGYPPAQLAGSAQSIRNSETAVTRANGSNPSPVTYNSSEGSPKNLDNEYLLNSFLQIFIPPILAPVEVGPKLSTTRAFFASLSSESPMVRHAIMAFSAFQLSSSQTGKHIDYLPYYDKAAQELHTALASGDTRGVRSKELKHVLAAIFLLTYTDLLTYKIPQAHTNLKEAYFLIQKTGTHSFTAAEKRLISWIRLLDARAVSTAGGEGLFLTDNDETVFSSSPAVGDTDDSRTLDTEIEDVLFDVLYHPGLVFYQKVQSFVGRVAKIDPWHRSRGSVEDETEIMAIAADISRDLHALFDQRPALMDHAVAGNLTEKYLAQNLATATTRSFRSYLANYYASVIHLHRVAYKQFPRTKDVNDAIANIKRLSHLMSDADESLPVNLLWPLLMWGSIEDNPEDRRWVLNAIRSLETVATNAKATADLLEEVQRRQDEARQTVDIRTVSEDFFAAHFAIM